MYIMCFVLHVCSYFMSVSARLSFDHDVFLSTTCPVLTIKPYAVVNQTRKHVTSECAETLH